MRQSRIGITLALAAIALAQPAAARAQATTTVLRSVEPFNFSSTNPCTGEPLVVSGELNITERITVDNQGKTHNAFTLVPSSVRGEADDGTQY
jgi:hypothetical protein